MMIFTVYNYVCIVLDYIFYIVLFIQIYYVCLKIWLAINNFMFTIIYKSFDVLLN